MTRAALVHDWLTGMRGGEKVLEVLAESFPEAPIYTLFHFRGSVSGGIESHPIHTSFLQHAPGLRRNYRSYLPLFPSAIESFDLTGYDLVVSSSHCVAKGVLPPPGAFHVSYCHTPMRYAWDQRHVYFPNRRGLVSRLRDLVLTGLRVWDAASAARVDRFVANSRFVASRIRRYYGRQAEVLPPPVDVEFFVPSGDPGGAASGDYCIAVAALNRYKRLELAIEGCERAGLPLRIVGEGPDRRRLERCAGPRTRFLGRLDAEALRHQYRGARCFVQPGVEDFGIAAVEALACGIPVVALDVGGVRDIVDDGRHGVLYSEGGAEGLAAAIDKLGRIRLNRSILRGRAEAFSGSRFRARLKALLSRPGSELEEAARDPRT